MGNATIFDTLLVGTGDFCYTVGRDITGRRERKLSPPPGRPQARRAEMRREDCGFMPDLSNIMVEAMPEGAVLIRRWRTERFNEEARLAFPGLREGGPLPEALRPMLTGEAALDLGVRVLYNLPTPTTVHLWDGQRNILQKYTAAGWNGGQAAKKYQKTIQLSPVKAELGFSAADYFSLVYEKIAARADVNMDDLTGTELEQAETALFKQALAENIRATMWVGDTMAESGYNTFDGFLKAIKEFDSESVIFSEPYQTADLTAEKVVERFDSLWQSAGAALQDLKGEGQLVFFVTSDIYFLYEKYLDAKGVDTAYTDTINGRQRLAYHGIPVVDVRLGSYLSSTSFHQSFCLLTDRRNLVLAVNTADFPGNEVRMWYNPDEMENRQRAVFMAGCDILDEGLVAYSYGA